MIQYELEKQQKQTFKIVYKLIRNYHIHSSLKVKEKERKETLQAETKSSSVIFFLRIRWARVSSGVEGREGWPL